MQWLLSLKLVVVLLTVANGAPAIAWRVFGEYFNQPLDGGVAFFDRRPIFGHSKTIRGIILSLVAATASAPVLGLEWVTGLRVGVIAMLGDLVSEAAIKYAAQQPSYRCRSNSGMFAPDPSDPFYPWARRPRCYFHRDHFLPRTYHAFPIIFQMEDKKSSLLNCPILTTQSIKRNFWRRAYARGTNLPSRSHPNHVGLRSPTSHGFRLVEIP